MHILYRGQMKKLESFYFIESLISGHRIEKRRKNLKKERMEKCVGRSQST